MLFGKRKNKKNKAVSHVVGFAITFAIVSLLMTFTLYSTGVLIHEKKKSAAEIEALSIANRVAGAIMDASKIKQWYPSATYSKTLDIPYTIAGYSYYIEIVNNSICVNSLDGDVQVTAPIYNLQESDIGVSGKAYGSSGKITVFCNKTEYIYKFDFGTATSPGEPGYSRITDSCTFDNWTEAYHNWSYRVPIYIHNPNTEALQDFQVQLTLDATTFNYGHAQPDGADIRFVNQTGVVCPYWIEKWNDENGISIIWVRIPYLGPSNDTMIYLYYGNSSASSKSDGNQVFDFFDNFSDLSQWNQKLGSETVENGSLVLHSGGAIISKTQTLPDECVIDVKAKAVGKDVRDASMFVRSDGNYYFDAYMFSSGNLSDADAQKNLAIVKDNSIVLWNASPYKTIINNSWYRLRYILAGSTSVVARYYYSDSMLQDGGWAVDDKYSNGYFGLCAPSNGDFIAYYDWILLHKFASRSVGVIVGGENSQNYFWNNIDVLNSTYSKEDNFLYGDFVWSKEVEEGLFYIAVPENGLYTVTFVVGDPSRDIDMDINITPEPVLGGDRLHNIHSTPSGFKEYYHEDWCVVDANKDNFLTMKFSDAGIGERYWTINMITIEKGVKGVKIK